MALSDERIRELWENYSPTKGIESFARSVEAEVRKDDEALIRQLRDALEKADKISGYPNNRKAITAARARLLDSDLSTLTERGAKAWAGVDPQKLREGGAL